MSDWAKQIDDDLEWRFAELAAIKVEYLKLPEKSSRRAALLRALWVMMYAHYEGFCKATWDLLLDGIEKTGCTRGALIDSLACASLRAEINALKSNANNLQFYEFCNTGFATALQEPASFEMRYRKISNLPPDEYYAICEQFGLPTTSARQNHNKLARLVSFRHEIAHGQKMFHNSLENYKEYEDAASAVMVELGLAAIDMLENVTFTKAASARGA